MFWTAAISGVLVSIQALMKENKKTLNNKNMQVTCYQNLRLAWKGTTTFFITETYYLQDIHQLSKFPPEERQNF